MDELSVFKLVQSKLIEIRRNIWVGARRQPHSTIVQWLDGDNVSRFWNSGELVNYTENCVEASYFNYPASLNDFQCDPKLSFVCEGECRSDYTRNGTICYKYFANALSWEQADRQCKGDNSTLIKVDKRDTLSLLQSIVTKNVVNSMWVGARTKSNSREFQWINGAIVSQFWNTGEPNDHDGDEDCVDFVLGTPGFLNDQLCKYYNPFICEIAQETSAQPWTPGVTSQGTMKNNSIFVTETSAKLTTPGVTSQGTPQDKSDLVTETSAQSKTPIVTSQGTPQENSDTTLLAVKIAVPLVVGGLLIGAVTAVVCIHLKRRKRQTSTNDDTETAAANPAAPENQFYLALIANHQTSAYDDLATATNPAAPEHNYYMTPIDNELHDYVTVE